MQIVPLSQGKYSFISYNEADTIRRQIGSALIHRGLIKGDMVGISSQNTTEWCLLALGCDTQVCVPLTDITLLLYSASNLRLILQISEDVLSK